jgi:hypothetical protein
MRHIGHMRAVRNAYKILVRRYGCSWESNIPADLKEM